jgi:hypothetical protein
VTEPTDEMRNSFRAEHDEWCDNVDCGQPECFDARLAAVAERVFQEQHGDAFQAGWRAGQYELCPRCGVALEHEIAEEQT